MDREELEPIVRQALNMVFANDVALLNANSSEWALAHRFAVYLEQLLPGWNVDCEYNRQGQEGDIKERASGSRIRPDIIVHHRGQLGKEHNLVAIELKKSESEPDLEKAREYTAAPKGSRAFQYEHGIAVSLKDGYEVRWFAGGTAVR